MTINKEQPVSDAIERLGRELRIITTPITSQRYSASSSHFMRNSAVLSDWPTDENETVMVRSGDLRTILASHPLEQQQAVSGDVVEQPGFVYFECGDCGFDSVQPADFDGSDYCPLCDGDNNRSNRMARRIARSTDRPEGKDARTALQGGE